MKARNVNIKYIMNGKNSIKFENVSIKKKKKNSPNNSNTNRLYFVSSKFFPKTLSIKIFFDRRDNNLSECSQVRKD